MDWKSYNDGKLGLPVGPNTNMDDYMDGVRAREAKTSVPGVAFTLIIISPFMFLIYPVLGLTLWAVCLTVMWLGSLMTNGGVFMVIATVVFGIAAFFPGYKLEATVSQFKPYRFLRAVLRLISIFAVTVLMRSGVVFNNFQRFDFNQAVGEKGLEGIVVTILAYFILRRADRLYFPVLADVRKKEEMAAKGIPDRRSPLKRFWYSLFWIIPVVAILNLIIRGFVSGFTDGPQERVAFYQQYSMFVYILDFIVWFTLSFTGVLPGTSKVRKYVVGQSSDA